MFIEDVNGDGMKGPRLSEPVDPKDLAGMMSKRSRKQLSLMRRPTGPKVNNGPLHFADPVRPEDINTGNLTLTQGCDTYVTPDCLRRKGHYLVILHRPHCLGVCLTLMTRAL